MKKEDYSKHCKKVSLPWKCNDKCKNIELGEQGEQGEQETTIKKKQKR